jgi:TatD DNase family protein
MRLIDTHAHLDDEAFDGDRQAVLARARAAGVELIINAGSTALANAKALALAGAEADVYAAVGLHPHEFPRADAARTDDLRAHLCRDKVVALGEIGLDYHLFADFPVPDREAQQAAFGRQLRLAKVFELPLIVHVREAYADALRLLRDQGPFPSGGVLHCYSGGEEWLASVLALGFHIGLGGPITYPKAENVRAVARLVPANRLLLETDAPYLPPQSRRGQRNEPAWLTEIADAAASARGLPAAELAEQTEHNARTLFRLERGEPGLFVYPVGGNLYINLTNRCSADCLFCPRRTDRRLHGQDLTLLREPSPDEVLDAVGDPRRYPEIVFCGFGEPTLRLPALLAIGRALKRRGGKVRVNTNGLADLVYGRDILPECAGAVDEWSVSLNTADADQYDDLVRPATGPGALAAVTAFVARAAQAGFTVTTTAVNLSEVDLNAVAKLSERLGARFRSRPHDQLGRAED